MACQNHHGLANEFLYSLQEGKNLLTNGLNLPLYHFVCFDLNKIYVNLANVPARAALRTVVANVTLLSSGVQLVLGRSRMIIPMCVLMLDDELRHRAKILRLKRSVVVGSAQPA